MLKRVRAICQDDVGSDAVPCLGDCAYAFHSAFLAAHTRHGPAGTFCPTCAVDLEGLPRAPRPDRTGTSSVACTDAAPGPGTTAGLRGVLASCHTSPHRAAGQRSAPAPRGGGLAGGIPRPWWPERGSCGAVRGAGCLGGDLHVAGPGPAAGPLSSWPPVRRFVDGAAWPTATLPAPWESQTLKCLQAVAAAASGNVEVSGALSRSWRLRVKSGPWPLGNFARHFWRRPSRTRRRRCWGVLAGAGGDRP